MGLMSQFDKKKGERENRIIRELWAKIVFKNKTLQTKSILMD